MVKNEEDNKISDNACLTFPVSDVSALEDGERFCPNYIGTKDQSSHLPTSTSPKSGVHLEPIKLCAEKRKETSLRGMPLFRQSVSSPRQHLAYALVSFSCLQPTRLRSVIYGERGPLIFVPRMCLADLIEPGFPDIIEQYRMASPGAAPGNVVVVVPPNNVSAESEERKFPRENEAKGAMQIIIGMLHAALGGILLFSVKEFIPLTMSTWYPFWGAALVSRIDGTVYGS
ncbi:hypothetical protein lerEdw1_007410 [Lerista edwardsae]|nr:hypothetical protein lerEdw1_007410 [Lerista edwardsae]